MTATAPAGHAAATTSGATPDDGLADRVAEDLGIAMDRFLGTVERLFRPRLEDALVDQWLPAVGGPVARLSYGGQVADVGCGAGATAVRLASRLPLASVHGFDTDPASIGAARLAARRAGVEARCRFTVAAPDEIPAGRWDVVLLGRLHDVTDPVAVARRARRVVASDGVAVVVGPMAGGGVALETDAGPVATSRVLRLAGFGDVRTVAATPFQYVLAAHPPR